MVKKKDKKGGASKMAALAAAVEAAENQNSESVEDKMADMEIESGQKNDKMKSKKQKGEKRNKVDDKEEGKQEEVDTFYDHEAEINQKKEEEVENGIIYFPFCFHLSEILKVMDIKFVWLHKLGQNIAVRLTFIMLFFFFFKIQSNFQNYFSGRWEKVESKRTQEIEEAGRIDRLFSLFSLIPSHPI